MTILLMLRHCVRYCPVIALLLLLRPSKGFTQQPMRPELSADRIFSHVQSLGRTGKSHRPEDLGPLLKMVGLVESPRQVDVGPRTWRSTHPTGDVLVNIDQRHNSTSLDVHYLPATPLLVSDFMLSYLLKSTDGYSLEGGEAIKVTLTGKPSPIRHHNCQSSDDILLSFDSRVLRVSSSFLCLDQ